MDVVQRFRFVANFQDGSSIEQNENDVSETDPSKSSFFDVLEKSKETPLISFVLRGDGVEAGVDLRDGHFELNGIPFFQHRPDLEPYKDFRVIYYRTVRRVMSQDGTPIEAKAVAYCIGWQVTHEDSYGVEKNVQRVLIV